MPDGQQDRLTADTVAAIGALHDAINQHDLDGFMATLTDDVVWETTGAPDGGLPFVPAAVRVMLEEFVRSSPHARLETEELIAMGDRAVERWVYHWVDREGSPGHVRGVDVFRVRDGKIAEMSAYVKG